VDQSSRSVYGQLGANYEVNEHHSFGATYEGNKVTSVSMRVW